MRIFLLLLISITGFSQGASNETLYLHTDKSLYLPGEILWFKPYVVHAATHKPDLESTIIYVEMAGKDGGVILQSKVENTLGGHGSIYIPQGLTSGVYSLRAYTLRMRKQHLSFSKDISIINPYLSSPAQASAADFDFQLFPEGGTLLHGIPGRIGHKLTDSRGKGLSHSVTITENGRILARLSDSNPLGMGSFTFTPNSDAVYKAEAEVNGRVIAEASFPPVQKSGVMLNATPEKNRYALRIHSTEKLPLALEYESPDGEFRKKEIQLDNDGNAEIFIPKNDLATGTSCLTLVNAAGKPLNERVVFRPVSDTLIFQAGISGDNLKKRDEATLSVKKRGRRERLVFCSHKPCRPTAC
ncbi:MAG: hypothetical protein LRY55_00140 [Leadbetterella sp.]|nr:hypothetical protein [Leadbetterella sp.]